MQDKSNFRLQHSPELQGLRAFSVAVVFFYHIDHWLIPGGFLGVDVFLVISGFLIGRKLLAELDETGRLNMLAFSAQRAKRLIPNAALTLVFAALFAFLFLPSARWADISHDIRAAALLSSNFHFARNAIDYLQIGIPPSPVLHFWSLSIEEQFYIGLPLLILLAARLKRERQIQAVLVCLACVALLSFGFGVYQLSHSAPDAYFSTFSRIWQLCVGVMSGWAVARFGHKLSSGLARGLSSTAAVAVLGSVVLIDSNAPYPGWLALLPTLAAALLLISITASSGSVLHRLLSAPFAQAIGDRSYSIYLWHWPFIAIAAEAYPELAWPKYLAAAFSLVMAFIAYALVEQPIRKRRFASPLKALGTMLLATAFAVFASYVLVHHPRSAASLARAKMIEAVRNDLGEAYASKCHLDLLPDRSTGCVFGNITGNETIMLFGDSHSAQWFGPVEQAATTNGWRMLSRTKSSCPAPLVSIWYPPKSALYSECDRWRTAVLEEMKAAPPKVVLFSSFSDYSGWIAENGKPATDERARTLWKEGFDRLIAQIPDQTQIWVIRDNPHMADTIYTCLSDSDQCGRDRAAALKRLVEDRDLVAESNRKIRMFDFTDTFCGPEYCPAVIDGEIVYRDQHHITNTFALGFSDAFAKAMHEADLDSR